MHFLPLLQGAPEVPGLLGPPEGPALDIPEALLALSLSQRYETPFEGVPHRHAVALVAHAPDSCCETPHGGEHSPSRETWQGGLREAVRLCWACPEAVVPETESPDPARGVLGIGSGRAGGRFSFRRALSSVSGPYLLGIGLLGPGGTPACETPYWGRACPVVPPGGRR